MRFERTGTKPIVDATEKQVRCGLGLLRGGFARLTDDEGSYVQVIGWPPQCSVEWRDMGAGKHYRAFQVPPIVFWTEPTKLATICGPILLDPIECFRMSQAVEVFLAFLAREPFPQSVQWRDITVELLRYRVAPPSAK